MLSALASHIRFSFAGLFLFGVSLLPSVATGADKCGSLDRVRIALHLTRTLYPELESKELSVAFALGWPSGGSLSSPTDMRSLRITLDRPEWLPPEKGGAQAEQAPPPAGLYDDIELPLYLNFNFLDLDSSDTGVGQAPVCRPVKYMNDHDSTKMQEVKAVINTHPEWTDAEELAAATKLGLRFGPANKAELLRFIPLKSVSNFYAPLRIKKVRFDIHGNGDKCTGCSFADLHWYIDAEESGTSRALQIIVEPFGGRIVVMSEHRRAD